MDAPADDLRGGRGALLEFDVGVEDEVADAILSRGVGDRTQKSKAAPLAVAERLGRRCDAERGARPVWPRATGSL
jgi:hypothetical protein